MKTPPDWFYRLFATHDDPLPEHADVAIAIGIGVSKDGKRASPRSRGNALKAAEFFQKGRVDNVLLVGGARHPETELTEAFAMLREIGGSVPPWRLLLEQKSHRTYLNVQFTLPIMKEHDWRSAIIVAEAIHAGRVRATFKKMWAGSGIEFTVIGVRSPYGDSGGFDNPFTFLCWNTLMWVVSRLRGYV